MKDGQRLVVGTIMAGHFIAAFAALGMPPFFGLILEKSLRSESAYLAGWLYVVPTFFTAVSSPWWGRLADRFGKKPLLLRAQLGLAGSFLLAGYAPTTWVFFCALLLQGLLGGTFAASNAYLATVVDGTALTRSLTLMQWSARAALVIAPAGLGLLMTTLDSPLVMYRYLALLPLLAAVLIWQLPAGPGQATRQSRAPASGVGIEASARQIYAFQFAFVFATVITFPYFVPFVQAGAAPVSPALAGWLFGLPHLVYLLGAVPLSRYLGRGRLVLTLAPACLVLAASMLGQAVAASLPSIAAWRVVMGLAMTVCLISLHGLIAAVVHGRDAGATFGWFESSAKWGAVGAGLSAGAAIQAFDTRLPFFASALVMFLAGCYLAGLALYRRRFSNS